MTKKVDKPIRAQQKEMTENDWEAQPSKAIGRLK